MPLVPSWLPDRLVAGMSDWVPDLLLEIPDLSCCFFFWGGGGGSCNQMPYT